MSLRMAQPLRKPSGIYWIRRAVPRDLRPLLGWEWIESLGTKDPQEAKKKFAEALLRSEADFAEARRRLTTVDPLDAETVSKLADGYYSFLLGQDEERRRDGTGEEELFLENLQAVREAGGEAGFTEAEARRNGAGLSERDYRKIEERLQITQPILKKALAKGDVKIVEDDTEEWLAANGFNVPGGSEDFRKLSFAVLKAVVRANEAIAHRQAGDVVETPAPPSVAPRRPDAGGSTDSGFLTDLFERWRVERKPSDKLWSEWSLALKRFIAANGDIPASQVRRRHLREFKDRLLGEGLAHSTITKQLAALRTVFAWAVDNDFMEANPAAGFKLREAKAKKERRLSYSPDDLKIIFGSSIYVAGKRPRGGGGEAAFWLPLLALYTGARLEELGQTRVADLHLNEVNSYLDIQDRDDDNHLKNENSRRQVPLHPDLFRMGLVEYAKSVPQDGRLFPDLKPDQFGSLTGNWSKWYGRWARALGITDKRKVFHSFRHTFKDACRAAGVLPHIHDALTGHVPANIGADYGSVGEPIAILSEAVRKIRSPIDLASVHWREATVQSSFPA